MAGWVFSIGNDDKNNPCSIIENSFRDGVFSTYLKTNSSISFEGTMTDYLSIKEGDNIYFFSKRKIYGIGEVVNVGTDCKYENYIGSTLDEFPSSSSILKNALLKHGKNISHYDMSHYKWFLTFKAKPFYLHNGIDIDDILVYKPETFKILRAFWKLSCIKLGDEENQSLKEILLLRNNINDGIPTDESLHKEILLNDLEKYRINPNILVNKYSNGNKLLHEMLLEACTVNTLLNGNSDVLRKWEYVSHQVPASPFKPIDYMDKIDIFGCNYIANTKIPSEYLVIELKKDVADSDTVDQVMKYVDWVCGAYTYSDYGMISAMIIANQFHKDIKKYVENYAVRYYSYGSHPSTNKIWDSLKLIQYSVVDNEIVYNEI